MRGFLVFCLLAAGCAAPPDRLNRTFFAVNNIRRVLVMDFEGNRDLTEESTSHFAALLAVLPDVEILRADPKPVMPLKVYSILGVPLLKLPIAPDGRVITPWLIAKELARGFPRSLMIRLADSGEDSRLEAAKEEARRKSADIFILGRVTSSGSNMGRDCASIVRIYETAGGTQVAGFLRRNDSFFAFSSHPVAKKAVSMTAADTLALLR